MNCKPLLATSGTNSLIWTAVNHQQPGILAWVIGDRSATTFKPLWNLVKCWHCFFYVTDGWKVYPMFIESGDQIVSKIYMTRVEGENTRLRHYLARLHRKTLCYSKSVEMEKVFNTLTAPLFKVSDSTLHHLIHYSFSNAKMQSPRQS